MQTERGLVTRLHLTETNIEDSRLPMFKQRLAIQVLCIYIKTKVRDIMGAALSGS